MDALQPLRAWLNGSRDYWPGVRLFELYGDDKKMSAIFAKGPTDFTTQTLHPHLLEIYEQLKQKPACTANGGHSPGHDDTDNGSIPGTATTPGAGIAHKGNERPGSEPTQNTGSRQENKALIEACDKEAIKAWKLMMNRRAELFAMVRNVPGHEDVNTTDRVQQRGSLALEVLSLAKAADKCYNTLEHVRKTGKLPGGEAEVSEEYAHVPDSEVKHTIDNLRKALSKLRIKQRKKETVERAALIAQHEKTVAGLLVRWDKIKS